ncbi:four-carbon acid sugar kinase family protein [Hydrogenoanaerobacterium sp.]|uniref:four-carbon acid sugar kinase family protein n=1 Tax=Hydrogenoanaerobacterium sp. TaxID=2953763 RepID=UPI00289F3719|nr:four-carbon acid sugar kinase family protein [Hydrogenoanaerobacterium sp.]
MNYNQLDALPITVLSQFPKPDREKVKNLLAEERSKLNRKIVVLDDDPTGIQTVHGVSVYTDWKEETVEAGFREENAMFFILTNSRGFTVDQTAAAHREIARNIAAAASKTGKDFLVISRGDSTLRGHYPLETEILREGLEAQTDKRYDGEIIFPFFQEGGRFTIDNIHYVKEGDFLIPAGQTEFARDKSFGYKSSSLPEWCEEKTQAFYKAEDVTCISLKDIRNFEIDKIAAQLKSVAGFHKVVVNAVDYCDVEIFAIAFIQAMLGGKEYLFRSAAAVTKVLGGVPDKPLLTKAELVEPGNKNGGIVLVGSHVSKTTQQMEELHKSKYPIEFIEFNQHLVLGEGGLAQEVKRVVALAEEKIKTGKTVAVYTRRDRFDLPTSDKDAQLRVSVEISDAVTSIVGKLTVRPNFIIAKGGITSSDVGTKALQVKRAIVMGQIQPGIPVWMTGSESKFPNMPYIIFPGNVGETDTLRKAVELLME